MFPTIFFHHFNYLILRYKLLDNQIKLIKFDYIDESSLGISSNYDNVQGGGFSLNTYRGNLAVKNNFYWNNTPESNIWSNATLNVALNNGYLTFLGNKWSSIIANTSWQVGGNTFANIGTTTVKNSYLNEIKNPVENVIYNAKVGLIYVSDYGYAASSDAWLINLSNYNDETILSNNWMYMGAFEWTISRVPEPVGIRYYNVFGIYDNGNFTTISPSYTYGVRPCFYLNSDVKYVNGDETQNNPYIIK